MPEHGFKKESTSLIYCGTNKDLLKLNKLAYVYVEFFLIILVLNTVSHCFWKRIGRIPSPQNLICLQQHPLPPSLHLEDT